jgi:hypothetical protein
MLEIFLVLELLNKESVQWRKLGSICTERKLQFSAIIKGPYFVIESYNLTSPYDLLPQKAEEMDTSRKFARVSQGPNDNVNMS